MAKKCFLNNWVFPISAYFTGFCALTYPLILRFHTHFFSEFGDGLQNAWNLWWIRKAITELHQNPLSTTWLHYPGGTSLLGHTLGLFNGFLGIVLQSFLTMIETYNMIILFAFIAAGYTAFRLALYLTQSYWSSLVAGAIFTFSQYHFAHAEGHMNLVSIQWIPLFILCWLRMIRHPGVLGALTSAIVLFSVLLCDNYYFMYCVFSAILILLWHAVSSRNYFFFLSKKHLLSFAAFTGMSALTSGFLVYPILRITTADPFVGAHDPLDFSLDLPALFIPGGHWRFATLTEGYWSRLPGNIHESSVYLGLPVLFLISYAWFRRKEATKKNSSLYLWFFLMLFFGSMALGPALQVGGTPVYSGIMPYTILQAIFPPLKISGVPVRMMVMVTLAAAMISAMSLKLLFHRTGWTRVFAGIGLGILMILDSLPSPLPSTSPDVPAYMSVLKNLPPDSGLMDTINPSSIALYYQTLHEIPLSDGYISRYPTSVFNAKLDKYRVYDSGDYFALLARYNIRYLLTCRTIDDTACQPAFHVMYDDGKVKLYQFFKERRVPERVDPDALRTTAEYLGYIDHYNNGRISGWATIPDMDSRNSQISILLFRKDQVFKIPVCRESRPDVSLFHNKNSKYDESGFAVNLHLFELADGIYKIGVYVETENQSALGMSGHKFQTSRNEFE